MPDPASSRRVPWHPTANSASQPGTEVLIFVGGAAARLKHFRDRDNLDLLIDRGCRMGGVDQLLLAETERLQAFR
jgi:hypothetical protein